MEMFAIILILIGLSFLESRIYGSFALKGISYSVGVSTDEAFEGEEIEIIEELANNNPFPIPWLKIEIAASQWLEFIGTTPDVKSGLRFIPSVFALKRHRKCRRVWRVRCLKRGVYSLDDTRIYISDLFGLSSASALINTAAMITVLPTPFRAVEAPLSAQTLYGYRQVKRFIAEDPFALSGVREYGGDEPMSRIHWLSTARMGNLMVYNAEYTTANNLLLLINFQLSEFGEPSPAPEPFLETSIKAAAWYLEKSAKSGISAAIITNSEGDDSEGGYLRYYSGLRRLAELKSQCNKRFSNMMEALNTAPFTDIFIFTFYISEKMARAARSYKDKNVVFFCNANEEEKMLYEKILPLGNYSHLSLLSYNYTAFL